MMAPGGPPTSSSLPSWRAKTCISDMPMLYARSEAASTSPAVVVPLVEERGII